MSTTAKKNPLSGIVPDIYYANEKICASLRGDTVVSEGATRLGVLIEALDSLRKSLLASGLGADLVKYELPKLFHGANRIKDILEDIHAGRATDSDRLDGLVFTRYLIDQFEKIEESARKSGPDEIVGLLMF